jgi:small nuclear ribonucleoprotein (snRNP)-like protein
MYSPIKNNSKDEIRRQAKEKKRVQLTMLLINKFRNKFNVNSTTEP